MPGTTWTEKSITYPTQPALGTKMDTPTPSRESVSVAWPAKVNGNAAYAFVVGSAVANDMARFNSSESAVPKPTLTVG